LENAQNAWKFYTKKLSSVHLARSYCVLCAKRNIVSSVLSANLITAPLVLCLQSAQSARCKNANGAVISMSAEVVVNKAVLIMELNVARNVKQVIAATARMSISNSVSYVTNIIALMAATTGCIDDNKIN
jgi:hypothetical protein